MSRRDRSPGRRRSRSRSRSRERRAIIDKDIERKIRERGGQRYQFTIFVSKLHYSLTERNLFDFFSHVGKVIDIRLVRDQRTAVSKCVAYVEFDLADSVNLAVALSGQRIAGHPIEIEPVAAKQDAAKAKSATDEVLGDMEVGPVTVRCAGVPVVLSESDLIPCFECFGKVTSCEWEARPAGMTRSALVSYGIHQDALNACEGLNGMSLGPAGSLQCQLVPFSDTLQFGLPSTAGGGGPGSGMPAPRGGELTRETAERLPMNEDGRQQLMKKLMQR